jgi:hypothetical protein
MSRRVQAKLRKKVDVMMLERRRELLYLRAAQAVETFLRWGVEL